MIAQVSLFAYLLVQSAFGLGANLCWRTLNPKLLGLAALVRQHRFLIIVVACGVHEAAGYIQEVSHKTDAAASKTR